jgi:hypothetical protein
VPWYRIRPSYRKPTGGFLAIGPRFQGEPVEGSPAHVLFRHHGMTEWTEIVAVEDVEEAPEETKRRSRWK